MRRLFVALVALLVLTGAAAGPAWAAAGDWHRTDTVEARLVSAVAATGDRTLVPAGLHLQLKPGWKVYWRAPGDAGLPPRLDWSGSTNLAEAVMTWPAPHRFTLFGIETFGYDTEVVFPIQAKPAEPGAPLTLRATVDLLVCNELCIPERFNLALALPAGPAAPDAEANLINRFAAQVPGDGIAAGLTVTAVRAAGTAAAPVLEVEAVAREPFVSPDIFVETTASLSFRAPAITYSDGDRRVLVRLPVADPPAPEAAGASVLTDLPVVLTLVDGARALEVSRTVPPSSGGRGAGSSLLAMLGAALVGGLLLNLMPCVLPVLSLKLLSVIGHGGESPGRVRAGFLASAAGILFSFLVLAAVAAGLKAAGAAVGWGIQFQQPLFLVFMVVLLTLFACNLWGLLEIPLPRWLADTAGAHGGNSLGGHFATGALATLLATPCSAPFLGTAVGFALARGTVEILAVFAALGLGLALPYLLVAAFPRLATRLPRPGRWMETLRRILGGALAVTGLWLLAVLAAQLDTTVASAVAVLMTGLALALWGRRRLPDSTHPARALAAVPWLLALAAFLAPAALYRPADAAPTAVVADSLWVPFALPAIGDHVAAGRTVFVDVTADWCLTCQANKKLVVNRGAVAQRLRDTGSVVAMRADWTRPDADIAAFLASFGRYGIPFNVVYGPGAPEGITLPELLSEGTVLDALDRAGRRL